MLRLFQKGSSTATRVPMTRDLLDELEISELLRRYFHNPEHYVTANPEIIRERNVICITLLNNDTLTEAMRQLFNTSSQMAEPVADVEGEPIQLINPLAGARRFYNVASAALQTLESFDNLPESFTKLTAALRELLQSRYPAHFDDLWKTYADGVEKLCSMTYHVHFSDNLTIDAIALSGIHSRPYTHRSLINRLSGATETMRVDSLQSLMISDSSEIANLTDPYWRGSQQKRFSLSVLQMLMMQTTVSINQLAFMKRGLMADLKFLTEDLRYALGMVEYARDLRAHAKNFCFAEILAEEDHALRLKDMVHPLLSERRYAVANDINIGHEQELILLGGINGGGKTTFLRTTGALQVLFQMGLPIPASWAAISPASGIFGVFSRMENTELYQGKLGQELTDLRDALSAIDKNSFFLGNEPITATSPTESYLLSLEALCILKAKQARGLWVTHLFRLFDHVEPLNGIDMGSRLSCMHTEPANTERHFIILPGQPKPYSGAKEVFTHK